MKAPYLLCFFMLALFAASSSHAATRYVSGTASGTNNGTSWANAYTRLQDALTVVASGDQIWITSGTYKPSTTNDRTQSFNVPSGVGLYGGFAGTESSLADRTSTASATILSGDLLGNDNGNRARTEPTRLDNTYNVVRVTGAASTVTFDRLTIQSGHSETYGDTYDRGAGIHFLASTVGSVVITNCIIRWNTARSSGGWFDDSNHAFTVTATQVIENQTERGGAVGFGSSFTVQNSAFVGNRTENSRDGYHWGGALFIAGGTGQVINCLFSSNYAAEAGGAIFHNGGNTDVINCTFQGNSAGVTGQTLNNYYSSNFRVSNSIIWSSSGGGSVIGNNNANTEVRNSLVQGGYSGSGTINVISSDPLFANSASPLGADGKLGSSDDGLRLGYGSPAINAGNNSYVPTGVTTDIASLKRITDTVDLGCYESSPLLVSALPSTGAPSARYWHTAVWTGTEMIVWGGENGSTTFGDGARYNPKTRQWTAVNATGAPSARTDHTAVWTGTEMIIFGGWNKSTRFNDGARYNPSTNSWTPLPMLNAPGIRHQHSAIWTGGKMIVFGGANGFPNYPNGGIWDSTTNAWSALSTTNAPANRAYPGGVWTGTEMFIWGGDNGYYRTAQGGLFNPSTNSWRLISTTGQPNPTGDSAKGMAVGSSVWTGSKMIVFGGVYGTTNANNPGGGIFDPTSNSWTSLPSITTGLARRHHAAVWAFDKMFVFGGVDGSASGNLISDNAVYDINNNQWSAGPPSPTSNLGWALQTALWTGESILVWGGITQLGTDSHSATAAGFSLTYHNTVNVSSPTATSLTSAGATLGGNVTSDGGSSITERGVVYSATAINADPLIGSTGVTKVTTTGTTGVFTAAITGLTPGTDYSYKAYATNSQGTNYTSVGTFTTLSTNANLSSLTLSSGSLNPTFSSATTSYTASVTNPISAITVTPTRAQANATIAARVNGGSYTSVTSGSPSGLLALNVGSNTVDVLVTAQDGLTQKIYTVTVTRAKAPQTITFASIPDQLTTDVLNLTASGGGSGNPVTFTLTAGPANLIDNVITFTTSGSVTITASQVGNANYLDASNVVRTFTVSKATAPIAFSQTVQLANGIPRPVTVSATPVGLAATLSYAGQPAAPALTGFYQVIATIQDPIYQGSASTSLTLLGLTGTDFGRVMLGRVGAQTYSLSNPGLTAVALSGNPLVKILGEHASDFEVSMPPATEIPPGGSVSFEIRFAPTQLGERQALVQLALAAPGNGPIDFPISGFGALATLKPQTITFNLPASLHLSEGPLSLTASASSGLPATFALISGPAVLQGNALTFSGPGIVQIEARQDGVGNYAAAKPVRRSLTVKANPSGLTLSNLTQTYDGTPRPITVLGSVQTPAVSYTINNLSSATPPTAAGSYPVSAFADGVLRRGTLVITRASLIVQPDDQSRHLGQPNPELTLTLTGIVPGEDPANVLTRPISITTQAKESSPPGVYPITSSGGAAANYTLIHQPGTLVVEGYVGSYEALLRDPNSGLPAGLLKVTVPVASRSASARLMLGSEPAALSLAGPLILNAASRIASGQFSRTLRGTDAYEVSLTISVFGELTAEVRRNAVLIAKSDDGIRLRDGTKGETVPQAGSYTGEIELAQTAGPNDPFALGWTTAKVDASGTLAMTGRLGDATVFTASLPVDVSGGYRFFAQPYRPARAGAHLSGVWAFGPQPTNAGRWQLEGAALTWVKAARDKDTTHRMGFGPLPVELSLSPWQPASRTISLAQLLGAQQFSVTYSPTGSASETSLPNQVGLNSNHTLQVLAPVTSPPNIRRWTARVNPTTGAFTGNFQLLDLTQSRTVGFSGVLRQSSNVLLGQQGAGHYLLPPLKGAANQESRTGDILFLRMPE